LAAPFTARLRLIRPEYVLQRRFVPLRPDLQSRTALVADGFPNARSIPKKVNTHIFNLQGQAAFKRRFHGDEVPTYIASRRKSPMEKLALLRLLKTL
jgi:hypothetical protein